MSALPQPSEVITFLDQAAVDLDRLGKELEQAHLDLGDAETAYDQALDEALIELVEEYEREEKRLPGEDVRLAKARKRIDFSLYAQYRKAKRRAEGLNRHAKQLETAVGARQSTLRGLREGFGLEAKHEPQGGEVSGRRAA